MQLPKTHYEAAYQYLNSRGMLDFFSDLEKIYGSDPSYEGFATYIQDSLPNDVNTSQLMNYTNVWYHLFHVKHSGNKIYYVMPALAARLATTSLNIDTYFIKSPFKEIFVQIDPGLFSIRDIDGSQVPVTGFYVNFKEVGDSKMLRIMACALLKPTEQIPFNDTTFYFKVVFGSGKLNEQLDKYLQLNMYNRIEELEQFGGASNIEYVHDFISFVLNTLLYITSKNPDLIPQNPDNFCSRLDRVKSAGKKRKLFQKASRTTQHRIYVLGSKFRDTQNDLIGIKSAGGIGAWKLTQRILVTGYWRGQWYGSGKDGSKHQETIWVDGYEKGPEFADLVNSTYIVK